jgi:predicted transcriptional regulator
MIAVSGEVRVTVKDISERFKVELTVANGFLQLLLAAGIAKKVDTQKSATGKGKPATVYSVPAKIEISLL